MSVIISSDLGPDPMSLLPGEAGGEVYDSARWEFSADAFLTLMNEIRSRGD